MAKYIVDNSGTIVGIAFDVLAVDILDIHAPRFAPSSTRPRNVIPKKKVEKALASIWDYFNNPDNGFDEAADFEEDDLWQALVEALPLRTAQRLFLEPANG